MTRKTCINCNRDPMKESVYCWDCNPAIDPETKRKAKARGGYHSRIVPHDIEPENVLPINSPQDLKNFLNLLLSKGIAIKDTSQMLRATLPIVDKFTSIFELELLEAMQQKLKIIEAKQNGNLLETGYEIHNQTIRSQD